MEQYSQANGVSYDGWEINAGKPVSLQRSSHRSRYASAPVIRRTPTAGYPAFPYLPPQRYPEFGTHRSTDPSNQVYAAVRQVLEDLGLDRANIGKPNWNPLRDFLRPGQRALIKPNWVMHVNPAGSAEALITHTSLIRVLIDYVLLALEGRGRVDIADAPLQGCDFAAVRRIARIDELLTLYRAETPHVEFQVLDLRKTTMDREVDRSIHQQSQQKGDPRGYSLIDLGRDSLLADIENRAARFRVTMYDHRLMRQHHAEARHEYLLANSVLDADLVINVPKLKTHLKAGVTTALKNLIGINGHKEYLPHHTNGCPATGGDQYPQRSYVKPVRNWVDDRYWRVRAQSLPSRHYRSALQVAGRALRLPSHILDTDNLMDGGWSGNDTIPRTTLDINNALYFLHTTGNSRQYLSSEPLRTALHIVDGVVAGEGNGPLRPSPKQARLVMGGWNPLTIDACAGRLIGLDANKVRLLRYGFSHPRSMLASVSPKFADLELILQGDRMPVADLASLGFALPETWFDAAA